jgi:hypothetical protein
MVLRAQSPGELVNPSSRRFWFLGSLIGADSSWVVLPHSLQASIYKAFVCCSIFTCSGLANGPTRIAGLARATSVGSESNPGMSKC